MGAVVEYRDTFSISVGSDFFSVAMATLFSIKGSVAMPTGMSYLSSKPKKSELRFVEAPVIFVKVHFCFMLLVLTDMAANVLTCYDIHTMFAAISDGIFQRNSN